MVTDDIARQIQTVARQATGNKRDIDEARRIGTESQLRSRKNTQRLYDLRERLGATAAATETLLEGQGERLAGVEDRFVDLLKAQSELRADLARLRGIDEGRERTGRVDLAQVPGREEERRSVVRAALENNGRMIQVILTLLTLLGLFINYVLDRTGT